MADVTLTPRPLTRAAFAPFGEVIETAHAESRLVNDGNARRFHDLAAIDVAEGGGRPLLNIFRARPLAPPIPIRLMERHPLGSQAFVPLGSRPFLVVVAPPGEAVAPEALRAFRAEDGQGVNYRRGVWHHPLLALGGESDFLVIDRGGPGENCDFFRFDPETEIVLDFEDPGRDEG